MEFSICLLTQLRPVLNMLFNRRSSDVIDQQMALKPEFIYNMIYSSTKRGFGHLFIITIQYLTNTDVLGQLAHFCILQQRFEVEILRGYYLEVVVHLY